MISKVSVIEFEKHHAFILIFLVVAGLFFANVYAFSTAYNSVTTNLSSTFDKTSAQKPVVVEKEVIVEVEPEKEAEPSRLQGLSEQLSKTVSNYDIPTGIFIQDLKTGETTGVNQRTTFIAASHYKLFVSYEIARQIDLGMISPNQDSGYDASGTSIKECLFRTLNYSDNPCGRALRKTIEADATPSTVLADSGFLGTSLLGVYPTTSAADVGLFFSRLYDGTVFSAQTNELLLKPMLSQQVDNRIAQAVPSAIDIAHKTADLDGYSHDAGIVYSDGGDYIVAILSGPWPNGYTDAPEMHIDLNQQIYQWFNPEPSF